MKRVLKPTYNPVDSHFKRYLHFKKSIKSIDNGLPTDTPLLRTYRPLSIYCCIGMIFSPILPLRPKSIKSLDNALIVNLARWSSSYWCDSHLELWSVINAADQVMRPFQDSVEERFSDMTRIECMAQLKGMLVVKVHAFICLARPYSSIQIHLRSVIPVKSFRTDQFLSFKRELLSFRIII